MSEFQGVASQPVAPKSTAIFWIALVAWIALNLPPLPYEWGVDAMPVWLSTILIQSGAIHPGDLWKLRWDYLLFPLLILFSAKLMWRTRPTFEESGFGIRFFYPALKSLLLPTLLGVVLLLGLGYATREIQWDARFFKRLIPLNGFAQQCVIQLLVQRQLRPWFGKGKKTAWVVTLYFVVLHFPNPGLMLGTLYAMYFWARCYQTFPNLYALSLSHALLSAVAMQTMPKGLLPSVSVGYRFIEKGFANQWWGWF